MKELIKDFTPLFSQENYRAVRKDVQDDIGYLLTLLNTHELLVQGGAKLYADKKGYEEIEVGTDFQESIPDNKTLSIFLSTTLAHMAEEAYEKGDVVLEIARALLNYDPDDPKTGEDLEKIWLANADMIQNLIYLYSEYLYRVFMQDNLKESTPITPEDLPDAH
ncbi:MAG: hypothetical protein ACOYB8_08660 [Eubacteriaceae bacterium]|jgi:hypothetical protein